MLPGMATCDCPPRRFNARVESKCPSKAAVLVSTEPGEGLQPGARDHWSVTFDKQVKVCSFVVLWEHGEQWEEVPGSTDRTCGKTITFNTEDQRKYSGSFIITVQVDCCTCNAQTITWTYHT